MSNQTTIRAGLLVVVAAIALALGAAPAFAAFGLSGFDGTTLDENGDPATQAGSHPYAYATEVSFNTVPNPLGLPPVYPDEALKDLTVELPPGLIGNPTVVPACPYADFFNVESNEGASCPDASALGVARVVILDPSTPEIVPVYNLVPSPGEAAKLGFRVLGFPVTLEATLSPTRPYHVVIDTTNVYQSAPLYSSEVTVWGVSADPAHDTERGKCAGPGEPLLCPSGLLEHPFLSLPTSCGGGEPLRTDVAARSWEGSEASAFFLSHDNTLPTPVPVGLAGCNALEFSPTLEARPTTNVADSPTGLDVDLHIPQSEDPDGNATAHLKEATVTLPEGLVVNPASANGLDGCSAAEIDLEGEGPASCPAASKIATVEVETPVLDHPLSGSLYLADPFDNPFDSLIALYIVVDDPQSGVVVKLAGEVSADPATGRLSSTFADGPQLPFEDLKVRFFGGPGASLRTPETCGTYTTGSQLTPWSAPDSGPPATPSDTWSIDQGPGGACATSSGARPHAPSFDAGTVSPIAGAYSPFVLHLRRADGSQQFQALTLNPPPGLLGSLAGTVRCSEEALAAATARSGVAERQSPSCPVASEVGSTVAGAGAGPAPYYADGKAYLAGPYKGAPLSLAIVTPATAGPFDLGTIVVRTALYLDSKTAQLTAVSDPIPTILEGIPLDVRSIDVSLDRPRFTLNPTSCDPSAVSGQLLSILNQTAALSSRFQLGECGRLGFKPRLSLRLKGGTKRGGHPALVAVLEPGRGNANLASISVALPRSEFLDQSHIGTVCTRVQFAADQCPAASIYGKATVQTPLLDEPLTGNVYLRSSDNLLPDLVPDLRGPVGLPVRFEAAGRTDSVEGGLRNTFDFVPDAPFTKLVFELKGGGKGLLENSRDVCAKSYRATVKASAHNGLRTVLRPKLQAKCPKKGRKGRKRPSAHRAASR